MAAPLLTCNRSASSFDQYFLHSVYERLGFPVLNNESYPACGVTGLNHGCNETRIDFS
jgi:hypothetical protein